MPSQFRVVQHTGLLNVEVPESLFSSSQLQKVDFPEAGIPEIRRVHAVSLAFLGQARNAARRGLYIGIWKRDKEKIKKSSRKDKAAGC